MKAGRIPVAALIALASAVQAWSGPAPVKRVAFIIESWYPHSHAEVIGTRLLEGYQIGPTRYASPVTIATLYAESPRSDDLSRHVAARYGFRVVSSIAEALLDDPRSRQPRVAVDGILIATREDPPRTGQALSPTPRLKTFREILRILDASRARVPIFMDKMVAANWEDSQAIVAEARRRNIPLMGGSVLSYMPLDRPMPRPDRVEVGAVLAGGPYWAYAFHAAELLQTYLEGRSMRETGVTSVRDVGGTYWSMPDHDRWGGELLRRMLTSAITRRGQDLPSVEREGAIVLFQYVDGTRAVLGLLPRVLDESEFVLGSRFRDGRNAVGGVQFRGPPFEHFAYLAHALVEFYITGRPVVPIERTLLTTGMVLHGLQSGARGSLATPTMMFSYPTPR